MTSRGGVGRKEGGVDGRGEVGWGGGGGGIPVSFGRFFFGGVFGVGVFGVGFVVGVRFQVDAAFCVCAASSVLTHVGVRQ
jgi:hypothetical protein